MVHRENVESKLRASHLRSLHEDSGLSYETIDKAGYRSSADGWEIDICNPLTGEVQYQRIRLDKLGEDGQKYTQPKGTKPYPYFSRAIDSEKWKEIFNDISIPIIITEGEKKADAAIQNGFITISIPGVWGWSCKKKLISPLKLIFKPGRLIYLCFDSDLNENDNVYTALLELAKIAYRHSCKVRQVNLPIEFKAIDDFFVCNQARGAKLFQKLLDESIDPTVTIFKSSEEIDNVIGFGKPNFSFDIEKLPTIFKEIIAWAGGTTHSPDEFIINGYLAAVAGALGKKVHLHSPGSKKLYPNIWMSVIAESGKAKTTGLNISLNMLDTISRPIEEAQRPLLEEYNARYEQYKKGLASYYKNDRKEGAEKLKPERPEYPAAELILLPAITSMEKLYERLARDYAAGIAAVPDELSILISDIKKERNKGGEGILISFYDGNKVCPQMSFKKDEDMPRPSEPAMSIVGASTVDMFFKFFSPIDMYSGLLQRFIFVVPTENKPKQAWPPRRSKVGEERYRKILEDLYYIAKRQNGGDSIEYKLSEEALIYWITIYPNLNKEFDLRSKGIVKSSIDRLDDEITFKILLILHCLKESDKKEISKETLEQALYLVNYYKKSLLYVLDCLEKKDMKPIFEKILRKLRLNFQDGLNLRDLKNACRGFNNPIFDDALDILEEKGIINIKEIENDSNNETKTTMIYLLEKQDYL